MISDVQRLCQRVTNWKGAHVVRRWVGAGMLEAERSFRRTKGCSEMKTLTKAIRAEIARRREQPGGTAAVPAA